MSDLLANGTEEFRQAERDHVNGRGGFDVTCPCCRATFEAKRPLRPFRTATADSVFGPPDVRTPPKNTSSRIVTCEHCGDEYRPARGTRKPRYCSKSCARRAALARKHAFHRLDGCA